MNVIGFVARVICDNCGGKGRVPGGQRKYGELVSCVSCHGRGSRDYEMPLQDFVSMIQEFLYLMPPIAPPTGVTLGALLHHPSNHSAGAQEMTLEETENCVLSAMLLLGRPSSAGDIARKMMGDGILPNDAKSYKSVRDALGSLLVKGFVVKSGNGKSVHWSHAPPTTSPTTEPK